MTTKQDLILFYAVHNKIDDFTEAEIKMNKFIDSLKKALSENEKVIFRGFGSFEIRKTTKRDIKDPKNSTRVIHAKPRKYVKFKMSRMLEDNICEPKIK